MVMGDVADFFDRIRRYYKFTHHEVRGIAIAIFVVAFIISFKEWGRTSFDLVAGLYNLFNSVLIVALSILIHDFGRGYGDWQSATG